MKLEEALETIKYPKNIMITDVESTCWDDKKEQGSQKNEIIQVGFTPVRNLKTGKKSAIFIKPKHSEVSDFCTKLTSITKDEINSKGQEIKNAYGKIGKSFKGFNVWASWGDYDKKQFGRMFSLYGISNFLPKKHINLRSMFAEKILKSSDTYAAPTNPLEAMKKINMKFIGRNHRGDDDAFNLAKLYTYLMNNG